MANGTKETWAAFRGASKAIYSRAQNLSATLIISPGQPYHETDKFEATIKLLNRTQFKSILILVGDTNYRITLPCYESISPETAHAKAKQVGTSWLDRNIDHIKTLEIPYKIIRWDKVLSMPKLQEFIKEIKFELSQNPAFKNEFLSSANEFVDRGKNNQICSDEEAIHLSLEYLIEESAAIIPLWNQLHGDMIYIYPQKILNALQATFIHFFGDTRILNWFSLRFSTKYRVLRDKEIEVANA